MNDGACRSAGEAEGIVDVRGVGELTSERSLKSLIYLEIHQGERSSPIGAALLLPGY